MEMVFLKELEGKLAMRTRIFDKGNDSMCSEMSRFNYTEGNPLRIVQVLDHHFEVRVDALSTPEIQAPSFYLLRSTWDDGYWTEIPEPKEPLT